MNPLQSPYWEYFEHLATAFAENEQAIEVINQAAAMQGSKARDSLLCMDYCAALQLSPTHLDDEKTIILEQGYHYFLTQIEAYEMSGTAAIPCFISVRDDMQETELSGGPLVQGQPQNDRGLIELYAGFQSYNQRVLQTPRHYFRYLGDRGIVKVRAKINAPDTKKIEVILSGWKINLGGLS